MSGQPTHARILPTTNGTPSSSSTFDGQQTLWHVTKLLSGGHGVVEVRIPDADLDRGGYIIPGGQYKKTIAGWFDDPDRLITEIKRVRGVSVFVTVNPVNRDYLSAIDNELKPAKTATKDVDIVRLCHWFIDIDPVRIAGISSTDGELQASIEVRDQILADHPDLRAASFWGTSGNGAFIIADLPEYPNDEEHRQLVADATASMIATYSKDRVELDASVKNPARIMALMGTMKCKGADRPERPFRLARIEHHTDDPVPLDLRGWLQRNPKPLPPPRPAPSPRRSDTSRPAGISAEDRGRRCVFAMHKNATQGQHGSNTFYAVCRTLVDGFGLGYSAAYAIAWDWNLERAEPPFSEKEVEHKVNDAIKNFPSPSLDLLNAPMPANPSTARTEAYRNGPYRQNEPGADNPSSDDTDDGSLKPKKSATDPHRLARLFIGEQFVHPDGPCLVHHRGEFHRYVGNSYTMYADVQHDLVSDIEQEFNRLNVKAIREAIEVAAEKGEILKFENYPEAMPVTTGIIKNTTQALQSETILSSDVDFPCWIDDDPRTRESRPPALEILPAANGLVDLRDLSMTPHTPRYFSPFVLSYDFNRNAPKPIDWEKFLSSAWPNDPDSIRELQKWFAYLLTPDTSQQKMFMLIGPPRCGKGTIGRVISALLGDHNVGNPKLPMLASNFGLSGFAHKSALIISDARMEGSPAECSAILECILNITGEDAITFDRKYKDPVTFKLPGRITIMGNSPPKFRDSSGAVLARTIFLKFNESFVGREDTELTDKLMAELPSILNWAIEGRKMLDEDGGFRVPKSAAEYLQSFADTMSPIGVFVDEACEIIENDDRKPVLFNTVEELFSAYREWCRKTGHTYSNDGVFSRNLQEAFPRIKASRPTVDCKADDGFSRKVRKRCLQGISLTEAGHCLRQAWESRPH